MQINGVFRAKVFDHYLLQVIERVALNAMLFGALGYVNLIGKAENVRRVVFAEVHYPAIALADDYALRAEGQGVWASGADEAPRGVDAAIQVETKNLGFGFTGSSHPFAL